MPRIPVSAYRLQFNRDFTFSAARRIIPYLHKLGITDIYASPYLKAKTGSLHGYDIVDPTELNPEIGTEDEYNAFISELIKYEMGQILDIVPNHMCIESRDNIWWMDVLENGRSARYADFFDIDWAPVKKELEDKILIPVLGKHYGDVLENQELKLAYEDGAFFIYYYENKFPADPVSYAFVLRHRLVFLRQKISPDNPGFKELLSIITSVRHLPPNTETDPEKVAERYREKEIIKKRLRNLCRKHSPISHFINENVGLFNGTKGKPESFDLLDGLLNLQAYRLSFWGVATEEINYRRFFDINSLAAIRTEEPVVFDTIHKLILKLIAEGKVTGLRVDHPDGLYEPSEYFQRLQRLCFLITRLGYAANIEKKLPVQYSSLDLGTEIMNQYNTIISQDTRYKPFYIVGEKILIKDEKMPEDWPIFSTTGYVFLNVVNGIFIKSSNAKILNDIYSRFINKRTSFQDIIYEKKKLIMQSDMSSEINTLGHHLNRLSEQNRHTRDFTLNSLTAAIIEVIVCFPIYRTYITSLTTNDRDRRCIELAVSKAKGKNPSLSASLFDFLKDVLLLNYPAWFDDTAKKKWVNFIMRFQQLTGPVMAKGMEDTAFYVYNKFISLNEVGGSPDRFGISLEAFHGKNIERLKFWPHALITTSTHDTKRSEDVRARLNVLSEIPEEWKKHLILWRKSNKGKKPVINGQRVPYNNEEYSLYQTLIGIWPAGKSDYSRHEIFKNRIKTHMLKALREAKVNTSWINPDTMYEDAVMVFIDSILNLKSENTFLSDFLPFQKKISTYGYYNSLSQTLLKITSPGVPDFYQGTELWNFRLVDPDNRGVVDYRICESLLDEITKKKKELPLHKYARELTINMESGMIKLFLTYKALNFRKIKKHIFERGEYLPLEVMGKMFDNVCAFARRIGDERIIVAVPRFLSQVIPQAKGLPFGEKVWGDSFIVVPIAEPGARYRNIFTDELITAKDYMDATALHIADLFANFPVAMLERIY